MDRRTFGLNTAGLLALLYANPLLAARKPKRAKARGLIVANDYSTSGDPEVVLKNAVADGRLIADVARSLEFEDVTLSENAPESLFREQLFDFKKSLRKDEVAFIYMAGHGIQLDGDNFFLLGDANAFFNVSSLIEGLRYQSTQLVVLLDICRTGVSTEASRSLQLTRSLKARRTISLMRGGTRSVSKAFRVSDDRIPEDREELVDVGVFDIFGSGVKVMFATDPENVAYDYVDESTDHSPFATAVARNIREKKSLDDVFSQITGEVIELTNGDQSPWSQGSMGEPIYLAGPPPAKNPSRVPFNIPG